MNISGFYCLWVFACSYRTQKTMSAMSLEGQKSHWDSGKISSATGRSLFNFIHAKILPVILRRECYDSFHSEWCHFFEDCHNVDIFKVLNDTSRISWKYPFFLRIWKYTGLSIWIWILFSSFNLTIFDGWFFKNPISFSCLIFTQLDTTSYVLNDHLSW